MTERENPVAVYGARLEARRATVGRLDARSRRISDARLAVFALLAVAAWLAWGSNTISGLWVAVPAAAFVALIVAHEKTIRSMRDARRAEQYYADALARAEERQPERALRGEGHADATHPYADDLDLFGTASLFASLASVRTRFGEATLARWLLSPAGDETVRARQLAIEELRPRVDFRERLAVAGAAADPGLHPDEAVRWASAPRIAFAGWRAKAARAIGILAVPALLLAAASFIARAVAFSEPEAGASILETWPLLSLGWIPLLFVAAIGFAVAYPVRQKVQEALGGVERASDDLALLTEILAILENENVAAPALRSLHSELGGAPAAGDAIARLRRLVDLLDATRNQFFAPIAPLLLWRTNIAISVEEWRANEGARLTHWLAAIGEWEAFASLSAFAFEHPDFPFPEIVTGGPLFEAESLGHPLIPSSRRVTNDVTLGPDMRLLMVSGSNMSGKSTMLRTVGVNAALALAGAPVCAERLRLSRLALGASIRINDSLAAGESRFYAEIKRLRQIVDLARAGRPLLFLLDEVLHGTNSHDRRIGAEGVIRTLVAHGAIGLVTTHDLALASIVEHLGVPAANVHFEDHLEDGRMAFDYTMQPGVVEKSNALELMRAVGLEVGE
ncbi:MAG: MutS-related protein [Thermoanaerobaculia bacterium]